MPAARRLCHAQGMTTSTFHHDRLRQLGRRFQRLRRELDELRPELAEVIRAADAAGVPQVEIVKLTGYTRDQVRQIVLPPERRRRRAAA